VNKTQATKAATAQGRFGYFAVGNMEAYMRCPFCRVNITGYLPRFAATYASGVTYMDAMVDHMMEEH
jgi:hypothetical protein